MKGELITVTPETLLGEVGRAKAEGFRLVTLTGVELDAASMDLLYHFDRDFQLRHLRLTVGRNVPVPSITPIYFAAFLVENEIQDLFGLRFQGLVIDYDGSLYFDDEVGPAPFRRFKADGVDKQGG